MAMSAFALDAVSGAPAYTGKMLRAALSALAGAPPSGRPLGATSGVRPGTPSGTVAVAGSVVTVHPHSGVLDVQADATTGPYLYAVTSAESKTIDAAHATYARWDRISIQLSDPAAGDGTSTPGVAVVYTAGTPAASPALPAEPPRSITLARVVVPQSGGGSASVVWMAPEAGSPWVAYAPSFTGLTVGNGTVAARWAAAGKMITAEVLVTFGSTSAVTGDVTISLPKAALRSQLVGLGQCRPAAPGGSHYQLVAFAGTSSTTVIVRVPGSAGSLTALSSSVPATWATGGFLLVQVTYEAA